MSRVLEGRDVTTVLRQLFVGVSEVHPELERARARSGSLRQLR